MTTHWALPENLLPSSVEIMRRPGSFGNEGLVLWLGRRRADATTVEVTHIVEVHGPGLKTSPLHLSLSHAALNALDELAESLGVYLVGQIHSHPRTFTDLSDLDKISGIRVQDFVSVVCPHYAQQRRTAWAECGIHLFDAGCYRRLGAGDVRQRVTTTKHTAPVVQLEVDDD